MGEIREIAGRANAQSQTFEVDVIFKEKTLPPLYSGLIAHTDIVPSQTQVVAEVPLTAFIKADGQQGSVYLVSNENQCHPSASGNRLFKRLKCHDYFWFERR